MVTEAMITRTITSHMRYSRAKPFLQAIAIAFGIAIVCNPLFLYAADSTLGDKSYRLDLSKNSYFSFLPIRVNRTTLSAMKSGGNTKGARVISRGSLGFEPIAALDLGSPLEVYWRGRDYNMFAEWWRDNPVVTLDLAALPARSNQAIKRALEFGYRGSRGDTGDNLLGRLKRLRDAGAPISQLAIAALSKDNLANYTSQATNPTSRGAALVSVWGSALAQIRSGVLCGDELFAQAEIADTMSATALKYKPLQIFGTSRGAPADRIKPSAPRIEYEDLFGHRPLSFSHLQALLGDSTVAGGVGVVIDDAASPNCKGACHYQVQERGVRDFTIIEQTASASVSELPYDLVVRYGIELATAYGRSDLAELISAGRTATEAALATADAAYSTYLKAQDVDRNPALEQFIKARNIYRDTKHRQLLDHTLKLWEDLQMRSDREPWRLGIRTINLNLVKSRESLTEPRQPTESREYVAIAISRGTTTTPWTWLTTLGDYPPDYAYAAKHDPEVWPEFQDMQGYFLRCRGV